MEEKETHPFCPQCTRTTIQNYAEVEGLVCVPNNCRVQLYSDSKRSCNATVVFRITCTGCGEEYGPNYFVYTFVKNLRCFRCAGLE